MHALSFCWTWNYACSLFSSPTYSHDRLAGLVVRRLPWERKVSGSNPACAGIFSGSSHTSDLNIGTPVATLPGSWRYRVSAGTGRPGVSILWVRWKVWSAASVSVWQHIKLSVQIHPWDTLACCWDIKQPTHKQTYSHVQLVSVACIVFSLSLDLNDWFCRW